MNRHEERLRSRKCRAGRARRSGDPPELRAAWEGVLWSGRGRPVGERCGDLEVILDDPAFVAAGRILEAHLDPVEVVYPLDIGNDLDQQAVGDGGDDLAA